MLICYASLMKRILVNLPEEQVARVDAKARDLGITRSELARKALDRFVENANSGFETKEDRVRRVRRALEEMRESGRRMRRLDPGWNPSALIREARAGRIRL